MLGLGSNMLVLELSLLLSDTGLSFLGVTLIVCPVLDWDYIVVVLFRQNFSVMDGLNGGVIMILVNFPVSGNLAFLALMRVDGLVLDARRHAFMDLVAISYPIHGTSCELSHFCIMMASFGDEVGYGSFGFVHFV